jgi:hypothetical protein
MIVKAEIIKENLRILDEALNTFTILKEYYDIQISRGDEPDVILLDRERLIKSEIQAFKITQYANFIDFLVSTQKSGQKVFYDKKIKNVELSRVLVENAEDESAKRYLRNKNKDSFTKLITSKRWENLCGYTRTRGTHRNNVNRSSAIIANFCIQNEIELDFNTYYHRINSYYTQKLDIPDQSILTEMSRTRYITDFIIEKLSDNGIDFRKANLSNLVDTITDEFKRRMLKIEPGEQIRCIENPQNLSGLTIGKNYRVLSKVVELGVLKVAIVDDRNNQTYKYPFRFFETISDLRTSAIADLLGD